MKNSENSILMFQDHLQAGGAARAAGRWAQLLGSEGRSVEQVAGDVSSGGGYLLSGKPHVAGAVWQSGSPEMRQERRESHSTFIPCSKRCNQN